MKYIDSEKLIAEIDRLLKCTEPYRGEAVADGSRQTLYWIKDFVTSLQQEQPEVDLDAEIAIYLNRNVLNRINNHDIIEDFTTMEAGELASHFYELGCRRTAEKYETIK